MISIEDLTKLPCIICKGKLVNSNNFPTEYYCPACLDELNYECYYIRITEWSRMQLNIDGKNWIEFNTPSNTVKWIQRNDEDWLEDILSLHWETEFNFTDPIKLYHEVMARMKKIMVFG